MGAPHHGVDWQQLKTWIARQEAYEAANAAPAPLTTAQMLGIRQILATESEPDVGSTDWVSLLARFCQAHQADGMVVRYAESAAVDAAGVGNNRWINHCTLLNHVGSSITFPSSEEVSMGNLLPVDANAAAIGIPASTPSFSRKRDAKQYAAKCCVEWLQKEGRISNDGTIVPSPKASRRAAVPGLSPLPPPAPPSAPSSSSVAALTTSAAASLPAEVEMVGGNDGSATAARPAGVVPAAAVAATVKKKKKKGAPLSFLAGQAEGPHEVDVLDDEVPATQRVTAMCRRLGLASPRYDIAATEPGGRWWSGRPNFGDDSMLVPPGLGCVENIYAKEQARQMIAEKVLGFLFRTYADRQDKFRKVMMMGLDGTEAAGGEQREASE